MTFKERLRASIWLEKLKEDLRMACEKCWSDASMLAFLSNGVTPVEYDKLLERRHGKPCTPEEQCGELHLILDWKDGTRPIETIIISELIPHIDSTWRTIPQRAGRLIEGFSMGGYGAGRLGVIHTNLFGAVSILAGGPLNLEFQGPRAKGNPGEKELILKDTFGNDLDYFKAQSPLTIAEKNAAAIIGKLKIRVAVGSRDFTADLNRAYSEHLKKLKIDHQLTVVPRVAHETMLLLKGLGEANWDFYRATFGKK
jgi:acetyl esterase/lipase